MGVVAKVPYQPEDLPGYLKSVDVVDFEEDHQHWPVVGPLAVVAVVAVCPTQSDLLQFVVELHLHYHLLWHLQVVFVAFAEVQDLVM